MSDTAAAQSQPSLDRRAELLAELGITAPLQRRLDGIARKARKVRVELEEARDGSEPGSDTKARCEEALQWLDDVLYRVEGVATARFEPTCQLMPCDARCAVYGCREK